MPLGVHYSTLLHSPGTIAAIVLGIVGTFAFSALWLFCACRRHRKLVREAALIAPENHAPGPLDDEIFDVEELGYGIGSTHSADNPTNQSGPTMEERYASMLAALHSTERFGRGNEGGSTGGIYGSRHNTATDMDGDDDVARASSPTLPPHELPPDDPAYMVPLSPPPPVSQPLYHQAMQPPPPPSSYYMAPRRKSSPGPDGATWFSGYSVAPSCNSHYARSQTLGSGSGSGSVDALSRTRTGSEEPLLGIGKATLEVPAGASTPEGISPTTATDPGGNKPGLGSAFGSPAASMYTSSVYPTLQYDTSGSHDTRTASGSGSYGYARSGTPSSFDVLRSVSSQGALSSAYSQGHGQSQGFRFGFSRQASSSSGSTGKKAGSNRHSFGVPPTSFKPWKDWGSAASDKEKGKQGEKQSLQEKDSKPRPRSWTSASTSGSVDEKHGRGSPVIGVRALLGRLRRAGHTPSPHSSNKDLPSPTKASMDVDPEKTAADSVTPPPVQIEPATPRRRRFSFILSNPDPHPPSPYSGAGATIPSSDTPPHHEPRLIQYNVPTCDPYQPQPVSIGPGELQPPMAFPTGYVLVSAPSPAPTEESRLAEGLLHPRLRTQGCSDASLRDFEDYSRPIGGVVKNRLYSTTTFGTQDEADKTQSQGTPVQNVLSYDEHEHEHEAVDVFGASTLTGVSRGSWFVGDLSSPTTARHSPDGDSHRSRARDATP
ncbi:hypothetical protein OG21DRAFT_1272944 [Imleria badia]|nr:hypothetical protein OG21DRAFT_1272944 [Imleria badia]